MRIDVKCPYCGYNSNRYMVVSEDAPKEQQPGVGDLSICIACAEISSFKAISSGVLALSKITRKELRAVDREERRRIAKVQAAIREARAGLN